MNLRLPVPQRQGDLWVFNDLDWQSYPKFTVNERANWQTATRLLSVVGSFRDPVRPPELQSIVPLGAASATDAESSAAATDPPRRFGLAVRRASARHAKLTQRFFVGLRAL